MSKLWIMSDLHLEFSQGSWTPPYIPDHDILILAGDIHVGCENAISYAKTLTQQPIILVAGNHEFYHRHLQTEYQIAENSSRDTADIHFLDNERIIINGVRFIGATLWTDFLLGGDQCFPDNIDAAWRHLNDFSYIATDDPEKSASSTIHFTPHHAALRHWESRAYIEERLAEPFNGPTVVITHHAPHPGSIHSRYANDILTAAFVSDLSPLIMAGAPDLWIHGHVHDCFDYRTGTTRIVCNPRGYPGENKKFDPALVIDI